IQENYNALHRVSSMDRLMDGRMPLSSATPGLAPSGNTTLALGGSGLAGTGDTLDAGSRQSTGGYLAGHFSWQSGAGGLGGEMGGFGQPSGFSGGFSGGSSMGSGQPGSGSPFASRQPKRNFLA